MGDNTCGCCRKPSRDLLTAIVIVVTDGAPGPVLVKLCTLCRHTHWRCAGRWLAQASAWVYERIGAGPCPCRAT